jgi:hypothetical protein
MRSPLTTSVALTLVIGAIAASPAAAAAEKPAPPARAAGGDKIELTYPSAVRHRVERAQRALRRATKQLESDRPDKAAINLKVVRRQMSSAWRAAKHVIRTTPPPPAAEDRVRAHASGDAPPGPALAAPADTALLVLTLQHEVAADIADLLDGADPTGVTALGLTLNLALDGRDQALNDIVALAPPAPASADRVQARASGGAPVASTFDAIMPNVLPQLDDELQAIDATQTDAEQLSDAGRRMLTAATAQVTATKGFVNKTWPPIPAED